MAEGFGTAAMRAAAMRAAATVAVEGRQRGLPLQEAAAPHAALEAEWLRPMFRPGEVYSSWEWVWVRPAEGSLRGSAQNKRAALLRTGVSSACNADRRSILGGPARPWRLTTQSLIIKRLIYNHQLARPPPK